MFLKSVIDPHFTQYPLSNSIAVAVSGGPDSMALLFLIARWCNVHDVTYHAITVDHQLRDESKDEAQDVQAFCKTLNIPHTTLTWDGKKPTSRIQESARDARYGLMADYCKAHDIHHLALAHHADDQMETVLFRLAKGSGLKGLGGMKPVSDYNDDLTLHRPLLGIEKQILIQFCDDNNIPYTTDPANANPDYARARMRQSQSVLEAEGLTAKRIGQTAKRLHRADTALDFYTETFRNNKTQKRNGAYLLSSVDFKGIPEDIAMRVIHGIIDTINPDHHARLEKIETLAHTIRHDTHWKQSTLGGVIFTYDAKTDTLKMFAEHPCAPPENP